MRIIEENLDAAERAFDHHDLRSGVYNGPWIGLKGWETKSSYPSLLQKLLSNLYRLLEGLKTCN